MKAYPYIHKHPTTGNTKLEEGMDLRDWFAGLAMQAIIMSIDDKDDMSAPITESAYKWADAMMKAREVKNEHS
jgi:hypothetical protein